MPDPVPTQEQLDEASEDFVYGYESRRLNLACRIVLTVCAPWITFAVLHALAAQLSLPSLREFGDLRSQYYFWNIWLTPVGTIVSTLWLLYLWRRPFKPKPIQAPGSGRVDGVRASRLKDAAVQQLSGFQGFVKSLFL